MKDVMQIGCTCPECEEHFLIGVVNTDAARVAALATENADLHTLVNTQAAIIQRKNDEIAELTAALSECDRRNEEDAIYAPALVE